eukprot:5392677-Pyramimonas_sp.AAC.1
MSGAFRCLNSVCYSGELRSSRAQKTIEASRGLRSFRMENYSFSGICFDIIYAQKALRVPRRQGRLTVYHRRPVWVVLQIFKNI